MLKNKEMFNKRVKRHAEICKELTEVYTTKNRKYGDSFTKAYQKYGNVALSLRIEDKHSRMDSILLNGENGTPDESIIDTMMDLANYAIMCIMLLEEEFNKDIKLDN